MAKLFYIFVNGIESSTGDLEGWHFRAERWIERNTDESANTYHYHTFALTRWVTQAGNVERLLKFMEECEEPDAKFVLVGHSNGCALICAALAKYPDPERIHHVHLIAGAVESSFVKNGLNDALRSGKVGQVSVWCDPQDPALRFAKATQWIPFLAYGHLGLEGPTYVDRRLRHLVNMYLKPGWGHSHYFDEQSGQFELVMATIADL